MEVERLDGRSPNQLRPLACSRNVLQRAHGSARWSQGDTIALAAVYGPKAGTRKNESPEKASIEVIWKPKTGQIGKVEMEYEMILRRTLQSICLLTIHPNTTTSVILQVVNDDGAVSFSILGMPLTAEEVKALIESCLKSKRQVNMACAALVDAGIPLKYLAVAICCGSTDNGYTILDPTKLEEQKLQAFTYLVFPNSTLSVLPARPLPVEGEPLEHGIITSVTHGLMSVNNFFDCLERGRSASAMISNFLRRSLQGQVPGDPSKAL